MKLAIGVCERVNGRCSTKGCFNALNNRDKHFSRYKDADIELQAFFSCNICSSGSKENIEKIAGRLKDQGVEVIHIGACAVNCKADRLEEVKEVFTSLGIEVVEGTH